ncbi:Thg1 domain-containing protein [Balamuthia mandrillaris]
MVRTAVDVAEAFHARAAYTFSDEISLILAANQDIHNKDPNNPLNPFIFGGKVPKIITLAAGLASTRFNWHIANEQFGSCEQEQKRHQRATEGSAHFDARAFNLPDYETCLDNIIWRGLDCLRNSKTGLARCYFSAKQLHDRSSAEMVAMLKQEHGVDWNTYPDHFKTGLLIKKKAVLKEMIHPITNAPITVTRKNFFCIGWENVRRLSRNDATTLLLTPLLQEDNQHPINQHQEHHTNATQYAVDEDNDDEEEEEESNKKQANGVVYTNRSRSLSQVLPLFTPIDYTPHR